MRKLPRKQVYMKMGIFFIKLFIHNTAMDGWIGVNKIWDHHSIVQGWNKNGAVKTCNDCLRQFPNVNNNYSDPWGGALHTSSTIHGDMNTDIFYTFKYVHNQSKQISFLLFFIPISASYFVQRNILPI